MATMKDIANRVGVSLTTVSNVVHGNYERVSPQTVQKILDAIQELHYVPNMSARARQPSRRIPRTGTAHRNERFSFPYPTSFLIVFLFFLSILVIAECSGDHRLRRHGVVDLPLADERAVDIKSDENGSACRNADVLERRAIGVDQLVGVRIQTEGDGRIIGVHVRAVGQAADDINVARGVRFNRRNRFQILAGVCRVYRHVVDIIRYVRDGRQNGIAVFIRLEGDDVKQITVLIRSDEVGPNLRDFAGRENRFAVLQSNVPFSRQITVEELL